MTKHIIEIIDFTEDDEGVLRVDILIDGKPLDLTSTDPENVRLIEALRESLKAGTVRPELRVVE